jgi:hypothetical protein
MDLDRVAGLDERMKAAFQFTGRNSGFARDIIRHKLLIAKIKEQSKQGSVLLALEAHGM